MPSGFNRGHPDRFVLVGQLGQGGRQKLVFALEVEVDDPRRKPCGTGYMVKGRAGIAMAADAADRGLDQLLLARLLDQVRLAHLFTPVVLVHREKFPITI